MSRVETTTFKPVRRASVPEQEIDEGMENIRRLWVGLPAADIQACRKLLVRFMSGAMAPGEWADVQRSIRMWRDEDRGPPQSW